MMASMSNRANIFHRFLEDWIPVFAAGEQTDSKGKAKVWTTDDLDQIVANFDADDSVAVTVGHPKHNSPSFGWASALKREGEQLFAKFGKADPKFIQWGKDGHVRNRSVQILSGPKGYRLGHIGFLGAMPPAVEGLGAIEFSAEGETFEFAMADAYWFSTLARQMRRFRDFAIAKFGQEEADRVAPSWEIEDAERRAAELQADNNPRQIFTANNPENDVTTKTYTQAELDAALAAAKGETQTAKQELKVAQFNQRLTANRDFVSGLVTDDQGNVRLTPAQAEGWAECLTFMQSAEGEVAEFSFTAADDSEKKVNPYEFVKAKLSELVPQMKLGQEQATVDPKNTPAVSEFRAPQGYTVHPEKIALDAKVRNYMREKNTDYTTAALAVGQGQ